jgi:hypothetical protein
VSHRWNGIAWGTGSYCFRLIPFRPAVLRSNPFSLPYSLLFLIISFLRFLFISFLLFLLLLLTSFFLSRSPLLFYFICCFFLFRFLFSCCPYFLLSLFIFISFCFSYVLPPIFLSSSPYFFPFFPYFDISSYHKRKIKERKAVFVLNVMKTYGGLEVAPPFFILALAGGKWSASPPGERAPCSPLDRRLVRSQSRSVRRGEEKNLLPLPGINPGRRFRTPSLYRLSYPGSK